MEFSSMDALRQLAATTCRCKATKGRGKSHCRSCYYRLPPDMRNRLYNRVGDGYEAAYMESCDYLGEVEEEDR